MHRVREGGLCMYKYMTEGKQNNLNECYIWMRKLEDSQLILFPRTASKTSSHMSSHTHEPTLFQFHRTAIMSGHCHVSQSGTLCVLTHVSSGHKDDLPDFWTFSHGGFALL